MKRTISILFLLVLTTLCFAEDTAKPPLPDAKALLSLLKENQKQIDSIRKNYICTDDEQWFELDKDGKIKKTLTSQYEFYFVESVGIKRLVSREGVPLTDSEKKKEDERVAKAEKAAREHRAKMDRGEHDKNSIGINTFLRASILQNIRREQYQGHEVIAVDFLPNPEFKPDGLAESIANKLGGTVWIDEKGHQVARLEAKLLKSQSAGMGLASVKEGTAFVLEQQKINNELWMPSFIDANIAARVLFKGMRQHTIDRYSNYKKFKSDTRILGVEEVKQ